MIHPSAVQTHASQLFSGSTPCDRATQTLRVEAARSLSTPTVSRCRPCIFWFPVRRKSVYEPQLFKFNDHFEFERVIGRSKHSEVWQVVKREDRMAFLKGVLPCEPERTAIKRTLRPFLNNSDRDECVLPSNALLRCVRTPEPLFCVVLRS